METKLSFFEEMAVANAISLRIRDLSQLINHCSTVGLDTSALSDVCGCLKSAYRKLTGVEYNSTYPHKD